MSLMETTARAVQAGRMLNAAKNEMCDRMASEIIADGDKEIPATATTALDALRKELDGIDRALENLVQVLEPLCVYDEEKERPKPTGPIPPCSKHATEIYELAQRAESVKEELVGLLNTINLS